MNIRFSLSCVRATAALSIALVALPAFGQTTRQEELAQQQAEKAKSLHPYRPLWVERTLLDIEQAGGFGVYRGFFVAFGDIKSGSGVALGPLYGKTFGNGSVFLVKAEYSIRRFKLGQVFLQSPPLAHGRLLFNGRARWQDAPELAVYPLGPASPKTRADYSEEKTEFSGQAFFRPVRLLRFAAGTGYERFDTGAGRRRPSVEERFTPATLPGLGADPDYLHTYASASIDSRLGLSYSRSGSLLGATFHDYRERDDGPYSFRRTDAIARQLIPILHGNWVFDFALRTSSTSVDAGKSVPFFLLPALGGARQLRGYANYRFRDRHSILGTAEYRWYVQEFIDMAIFYEAGKVAPRWNDIDFNRLKSDVGIGIRFHGPQTTALRFEVARGREGLRLIVGFGPSSHEQ